MSVGVLVYIMLEVYVSAYECVWGSVGELLTVGGYIYGCE